MKNKTFRGQSKYRCILGIINDKSSTRLNNNTPGRLKGIPGVLISLWRVSLDM